MEKYRWGLTSFGKFSIEQKPDNGWGPFDGAPQLNIVFLSNFMISQEGDFSYQND